ncbi:hypothetical protein A1122_05470 [Yersinia pestis A1122]|nr:hypothetical protein A1122_05470 [Yersinia pestis A1122]
MYLRRLYDLPVLSVAGTLSITSGAFWSLLFSYIFLSSLNHDSAIFRMNVGFSSYEQK